MINAGTLHRNFPQGFIVVDLAERVGEAFDLVDGSVRRAERLPLEVV